MDAAAAADWHEQQAADNRMLSKGPIRLKLPIKAVRTL